MYKRKIDNVLANWKETKNHFPLIIKGVRQCGKTFSVKHFAYTNYKHVVYLDFREHPEYRTFFQTNLSPKTIILGISSYMPEVEIVPHKTCFIFDEIQDCPMARASLKYFHEDGRFDVICTGSFLGVNGYKTKEQQDEEQRASIPVGYEDIVNMYPLDFEEWLWANGYKPAYIDSLRQYLLTETNPMEAIHERMTTLLREYIVVGGMPDAVRTFLETHQIGPVLKVQQRIISEYKDDMIKYAMAEDKPRIRECFESIPSQMAKEYNKFTYCAVRKGSRGRDYNGCLQWIEDAGIIRRCYNIDKTELPLDGNKISSEFKVYMADIGLLVSMLEPGTQSDIMQGNMLTYKGAIYENLMADMLGKMGRKLYYYHKPGGVELDFVMRYKDRCTPVECKARTGNAKSMRTVLNNYDKYHIDQALKLGDYRIGRDGALLTLPFYLGFLLK